MCLEIVSPGARRVMRRPEMTSDTWVMCLRASGSDAVLARYRKELGSAVSRELQGDSEEKMWREIENFPAGTKLPNDSSVAPACNHCLHINVPPKDVLVAIDTVNAVAAVEEIQVSMIGRVGMGHVLVAVSDSKGDGDVAMHALIEGLRTRLNDVGVKADGKINPWPISPANRASMQAVKQALDPNNVLRARDVL
jgi:FAD/FMN-containing dehydrogenase